jgi:hypothetical protein
MSERDGYTLTFDNKTGQLIVESLGIGAGMTDRAVFATTVDEVLQGA